MPGSNYGIYVVWFGENWNVSVLQKGQQAFNQNLTHGAVVVILCGRLPRLVKIGCIFVA